MATKETTLRVVAETYGADTGVAPERLVEFLKRLDKVGMLSEWGHGFRAEKELETLKRIYRKRYGAYNVDGREVICISEPWTAQASPKREPVYHAYAMDPDATIEDDPSSQIDDLRGEVKILLLTWKSKHWPEESPMLADADWEHPDSCEPSSRYFTVWEQLGR